MTATFRIPEHSDLVVASDIHIRGPEDERARLLESLIDAATNAKVKAFVLNGDIFDFFFGWSEYFIKKYDGIFTRLEKLGLSGCRVLFVEGNHEFGLDRMTLRGVRFMDGYGEKLELSNGQTVLIVHGDLMKHDPWYLAFRGLVRSPVANILASIFPQRWLDGLTLWFATTSRKKDKYRTLHHEKILGLAKSLLDESKARTMIFGHFHHPYDETLPDGRKILSVDSWDKPSCLVMIGEQFNRVVPQ